MFLAGILKVGWIWDGFRRPVSSFQCSAECKRLWGCGCSSVCGNGFDYVSDLRS